MVLADFIDDLHQALRIDVLLLPLVRSSIVHYKVLHVDTSWLVLWLRHIRCSHVNISWTSTACCCCTLWLLTLLNRLCLCLVLREVGRGFLRIGLGLLHLRGWLVLLDVGLRPFCTRLHDWLGWLVWHSIDILVEVDVIQRSVVYAQGVRLYAGEQHESPLIGNTDVSDSLGWDTQAVE